MILVASVVAWDADAAVTASTWAELSDLFTNASADADAPTEVILAADITAGEGDTKFTLPNKRYLVLDLNGHTIDRNMSAATSDGYVILANSNSSLTILDNSPGQTGTITGGWGSGNVGCIVINNATFRLEGGTISGNRIDKQGGSAVTFAGTFYMTGGTITGNIANTVNTSNNMCGAVYFANNANFYMSGGSITGNYCGTTTSGSAGLGFYLSMGGMNVHLSGSYTLSGNMQGTYDATTGTWSNLQPSDYLNTNRCRIYIDDAIAPTAPMAMVLYSNYYTDFTRGWSTFMDGKDPENCFTLLPYVTDRGIGVVDGEATIGTLHAITLGDNITASATSAAPGRPVTFCYNGEVPEDYQLVYSVTIDGSNPAETVAVTLGDDGANTFVMPDADVTVSAEIVLDGFFIDSTNFPDANFRDWLLSQSYGSDGALTNREIADITSINVPSKRIADLTGIEHFTALKNLNCLINQLTSLNVSQNTALTTLNCSANQLDTLDVSHNTALTYLNCSLNQLTSLDLSLNTALETLKCYSNPLETLDVSLNTELTYLDCNSNQLDTLDVSLNTALTELDCSDNQLTVLDVSHNTALTELYCSDNQLTSLNLSHNTALTYLDCYNNQINGGNMAALVASLPTVDVADNGGQNGVFRVVDLDAETEQNVITPSQVTTARGKNWTVYGRINGDWEEYGGRMPINSINFPDTNFRNYLLSQSYGSDGLLTAEEIAGITTLYLAYKRIADLTGIEHFTALKVLQCYSNQLTSLDLSHNTLLSILDCSNNQLTALNVSHNTALTSLDFYRNQLDTIDVSHNTNLEMLRCSFNQLTSLDVSLNSNLTLIFCQNNRLTALDLSHNTALTRLDCYNNQISGEGMAVLVASLPAVDVDNNGGQNGTFRVVDLDSGTEQNVITTTQVTMARDKNWNVLGLTNDDWEDYDGSEPQEYAPGDLNGDGTVDVADVNICINVILERVTDPAIEALADLNGDGTVDVADVNMIINIILSN